MLPRSRVPQFLVCVALILSGIAVADPPANTDPAIKQLVEHFDGLNNEGRLILIREILIDHETRITKVLSESREVKAKDPLEKHLEKYKQDNDLGDNWYRPSE